MIRNTTLLAIIILVTALFVPFAVMVPRREAFEVLNAICVATAAGAALGWSKSTWDAVRLPPRDMTAGHVVVVAVFLLCVAAIGVFIGQWLWRALGRPDWVLDSTPALFSRWIFAGALGLAMTANWSSDGIVRVAAYKRTMVLVFGAIMVAAALIALGLS